MSFQSPFFAPTLQHATPQTALGSYHIDELGKHYQYGQYSGTHTAGRFSILTQETFVFTPMTTALVGTPGTNWKNLGVACRSGTASYYGWFWIGFGEFECIIENAFAAADVVYTTANAGIPGTNSSSAVLDAFKSIDAGVTSTRVTCMAAGRLTAGFVMAHD